MKLERLYCVFIQNKFKDDSIESNINVFKSVKLRYLIILYNSFYGKKFLKNYTNEKLSVSTINIY